MAVVLPLFFIGLVVTLAFAPVFRWIAGRALRDRDALVLIGAAILAGYMGGGALVWWLVPQGWELSFRETIAASVDAEKYGHPIEHYAECAGVMVLCACMAGAAVSGLLAATTARFVETTAARLSTRRR